MNFANEFEVGRAVLYKKYQRKSIFFFKNDECLRKILRTGEFPEVENIYGFYKKVNQQDVFLAKFEIIFCYSNTVTTN